MLQSSNIRKFADKLMLRRMGYFNDQQGIMKRYIRESNRWKKHLENTKEFILRSAENKKKGVLMVLGSGWLLDLPIVELSEMFEKVYLVDIIHPSQITKKIEGLANVTLLTDDITGGMISKGFELVKKDKKSQVKSLLSVASDTRYNFHVEPDFVISLNILNQLNIILIDYLKKFTTYSDSELQQIAKSMQANHIKCLPEGKSCLISDIEEEQLDDQYQIVSVIPLAFSDLPKGNFSEKWTWEFDTNQSYNEEYNTYLNVVALDI